MMRITTILALVAVAAVTGCRSTPTAGTSSAAPTAEKAARAGPIDYGHYDAVLADHLTGGLLDYAAIRKDPRWKKHLAVMKAARPETLAASDRKAFWTNAYNTFCIDGILRSWPESDGEAPPSGPNVIDGFFDQMKHEVAGTQMTVNAMQYETLMPEFKDARLHFILVCSDFGCPPLQAGAFTGADIEQRLTDASYRFARDSGRFEVDVEKKVVRASKLFDKDWYAKDFTGDPARPAKDAVQYMARWATPEERALLLQGDYTVEIIPWDWRLNVLRPEAEASK